MKRRYIAAKININENIFTSDVPKLINRIPEAILNAKPQKLGKWTWTFVDVDTTESGFVFGKLSRSRKESKLVIEMETKKTTYQEVPNSAYIAFFFYDPKTEILIFQEAAHIDRNDFMRMFARLISYADPSIGEIVINVIPVKEEIYERLRSIEVLTKIEFELIPPNFLGQKELGSIKKIVTDANATKAKFALENEKGVNIEIPLVEDGIEYVSNGYGEVKAKGYNPVKEKTKKGTRTRKNPKQYQSRNSIMMQEAASVFPLDIIDELKNLFNRASAALKKGSDDDNGESKPE